VLNAGRWGVVSRNGSDTDDGMAFRPLGFALLSRVIISSYPGEFRARSSVSSTLLTAFWIFANSV
jgi:hypothetical protein